MKKTIFFFSIFFVGFAYAQSKEKLLNQYFDSLVKYDQGMGSISIFEDGKEKYSRFYGYQNIELEQKASKKTKYRIGSISKIFTAVCILQMVDEGRIKLDQKLALFFPDIPNANHISLEQLLRHRSGLHNFLDDNDYMNYLGEHQSREAHLNRFIEKGVDFEPGEKYSYSNTNYVLLAFICEEVDKAHFASILEKRILHPLKLKNTYHANNYDTKNNEALSYYWATEWLKGWQTHGTVSVGAGSMVSTVKELNQFFTQLVNGKLLSENSFNLMRTMVDNYGLGLIPIPWGSDVGYGHTGGIDGFQSVLAYFPEHKISVAYCGNGIKLARNEIVLTTLEIYSGKKTNLPDLSPKKGIILADVSPYLGKYQNSEINLEIIITGSNGELFAQATGQSRFPLKALDENTFVFDAASITMRFDLSSATFLLEQGGGHFVFTKKK